MAFIINEQQILQFGGNKGVSILLATYTNTLGSTGGVINPGYSTGGGLALAESLQLRKIYAAIPVPSNTAGNAPIAAISFNAVKQADEITLTTVADQDGTLLIVSESAGR